MPAKVSQKAPMSENKAPISHARLPNVVPRDEYGKLTESAKDDKREGVTNDPLANGSEDHEKAAEKEICGWNGQHVRLGPSVVLGWEGRMYQYRTRRSHQHLSSP